MTFLSIVMLLGSATTAVINTVDEQLAKADATYRQGGFDEAMAQLEALLKAKEGKPVEPRAKALACGCCMLAAKFTFGMVTLQRALPTLTGRLSCNPTARPNIGSGASRITTPKNTKRVRGNLNCIKR